MFKKPGAYQNPTFSFSLTIYIVGIRVSAPPQKHHPVFLSNFSPLKLANCPSHPSFLGNPPLYIGFSWAYPP